jgi:hypothetical protein
MIASDDRRVGLGWMVSCLSNISAPHVAGRAKIMLINACRGRTYLL